MTEAPPRPAVVPLPAPDRATPATQQQRRLRYTATLAGLRARAAVTPAGSLPRLQLCGAANLLTALGVRVDVVQPRVAWPRDHRHRLQVENTAGLLGDLALLVGVPRTTEGWADVADRVLPLRPSRPPARRTSGALSCPVSVGFRTADGPLPVTPRTLNDVVAVRGLVIDVRLHEAREERRAA
ncbi:hypothetical protein [Blastococcus litoris]|uniref:hypothetical protein n=1 Tax=Blastococcus litoris TaxID=2171622 RepID=UPI000E30AB0C|nr:hypothetical protein [Blastococcus litoris]